MNELNYQRKNSRRLSGFRGEQYHFWQGLGLGRCPGKTFRGRWTSSYFQGREGSENHRSSQAPSLPAVAGRGLELGVQITL